MKPRHQVSRAAIELIKRFEGFREQAIQLPDGRWTLGHGHTLTARQGAYVSERDAEALLVYDLIAVSHAVNEHTYAPLNQNQFDALCAFAFNIGLENFRRSGVLRLINEGQPLKAACAMELWRTAELDGERVVIDALVRRRAAEKALFLTPPEGFVPAPTPVLAPRVDVNAVGLTPVETPAVVRTEVNGEAAVITREHPSSSEAATDAPSAPEAAAAAAVERLTRIFAEETAAEAPPTEPADAAPAEAAPAFPAAAEPGLPAPEAPVAEAFVEPGAKTETAPAETREPSQALTPAPSGEPGALPPPEIEAPEALETPGAELEPPPSGRDSWSLRIGGLAVLALLGAVLFAAGLYWMLGGAAAGEGLLSRPGLGWAVGVIGVLLFGVMIYLLLDRLGRGEEEPDPYED